MVKGGCGEPRWLRPVVFALPAMAACASPHAPAGMPDLDSGGALLGGHGGHRLPGAEGNPCRDGTCDPGLVCRGDHCVTESTMGAVIEPSTSAVSKPSTGKEGPACVDDGSCATGQVCKESICVVEGASLGGSEDDANAVELPGDSPAGASLLVTWNVQGRSRGDQTPTGPIPHVGARSTEVFATSEVCASCHANQQGTSAMRDGAGRPIAPFDLWQASMKANSARDPLFRAVLSQELSRAPAAAASIEATCLGCHAPMAVRESELTGGPPVRFTELFEGSATSELAADGVSCSLCHQIEPQRLGSEASFGVGFEIAGDGTIYGPHANPFAMPMLNRTGFMPTQSDHMTEAALCGSCHTLGTEAIAPDGTPLGLSHQEQAPYLEWRNSAFTTEGTPGAQATTCQGCHMPTVDEDGAPIETHIAKRPPGGTFPPTAPRSPYGRHLFLGGNTLVPQLLRDEPSLNAAAPAAAFDAAIALTTQQLQTHTASLSASQLSVGDDGNVELTLRIRNLTGHKFPTAYPSRRAFLQVVARDASGAVVFRSGGFDETGRLLDGQGKVLASERLGAAVMPHYDLIDRQDQVQVYESVMSDSAGAPTSSLLAATGFLKDNRLLPEGYDPAHPDAARTAPHGIAGDANFTAGMDQVRFILPAGTAQVEARLYYQVAGARWLRQLWSTQSPSIDALADMLGRADLEPVWVAEAHATR